MSTLITGANGFVGRQLAARIDGAIPATRATADLTRPLPHLTHVSSIVHCAAEIDDRAVMRTVNVDGTRRLVEWARSSGVRQFVYISTGGEHGLYSETKREAESIVLDARQLFHVQVLRLFFPYGPGQGTARLLPRLIHSVRHEIPICTGPDGGPRLSLTWIDDVVESIARSLRLEGTHCFDVGGPSYSIREIASAIGDIVAIAPILVEEAHASPDLIADTSALRTLTQFEPATPLDQGLRRFVSP